MSPDQLSGTLQNDILKEYVARGTYAYPPRPSMRLVVDVFKYCAESIPRWNTISISGYHMREAGATAVQELAFTFANAIAYVQAAVDAGLAVDDFAPRLSFFFVAQNNLLEEVAKYRAARRMWATIMKERFGAKDPRSLMLRFHTQTAGVTLTAQQPDNNVIRSTVQAMAAILGGTQSLHVNSKDEALGLPTEESAQLSLRTQQIIAHESGVADVVDPLGGSWYVESLTDQLEQRALEYIGEIDRQGGAVAAIEQGYQVREIGESAYRHQREVDTGDRTVVGVNRYVTDTPPLGNLLRVDPEVARQQAERLARLRQARDNAQVKVSLARLEEVARTDENTIPVTLECVEKLRYPGRDLPGLPRRVWRATGGVGLLALGRPESPDSHSFLLYNIHIPNTESRRYDPGRRRPPRRCRRRGGTPTGAAPGNHPFRFPRPGRLQRKILGH